ncbi:Heavy metal-associated isoprenylated plant protein 26 [Acorus calamus]|uniref:Heavy metal-associated isoprenylated plant protein 26 n=1 Tax=Acorus calamus TaxID=4465 RepID=A0AAV9D2Q0_ACOCL|nr:Heavy metal-associated isoprenylated plant protein 26 [Acorus calamus]
MAKKEDLKSIDLKVYANCCKGCKKKVLKYLNTKGVLEIKIHPTLPKVTVVGSVDSQTLLKKLSKGFKKAELWDAIDKTSSKSSDSSNNNKCETNKGDKKGAKETDCTATTNNTVTSEVKKIGTTVGPPIALQDMGSFTQPYAHVYYAVGAYPPPCCVRDHHHAPPVQSLSALGFAEYFDDENTVGCVVM